MSRRPRLFASDLDGTLFAPDHQLSDATVAALRAARAAGVPVIAATGRGPRSAVPRLRPHAVIEVAVCSNGALVHDVVTDQPIESSPIPVALLADFVAAVTASVPDLACSWEMSHGYGWHDAFDFIAGRHEDLKDLRRGNAFDPDEITATPITKLMAYHPELDPMALVDHLRAATGTELTMSTSGVGFVELTAPGVTKATALARLCERHGVDPADVVAYGDNQNDVAMLSWAGTGVAMGNAHDVAKLAADVVIGTNHDDSVARDMLARLTDDDGDDVRAPIIPD